MASVSPEPSRCDVITHPYYTSLFNDHLLRVKNLEPVTRINYQQIWPSVFFLFCLLLLVLIKFSSLTKVVKIIQSSFSLQALRQLEREEQNPFRLYAIGLNSFFIVNVSFLLYKVNSIYKLILVSNGSFNQFLFFVFIVILVVGFKITINALLSFFTKEQKVISDYFINSLFINQTFGLFLFPCIILMELSPFDPIIFICAASVILAFSILLKWYKGVIIGLVEERIGFLQIFSYFCSLEILPVFILVKYIIETF